MNQRTHKGNYKILLKWIKTETHAETNGVQLKQSLERNVYL